jgi:hypothetical protein
MDLKAYVNIYSLKSGTVERRKESRGSESNFESLGSQMLQRNSVYEQSGQNVCESGMGFLMFASTSVSQECGSASG